MSEQPVDLKNLMPTERKSMWKTAEERRMSDLTRVLEWLERRQGKKKQTPEKQKPKVVTGLKGNEKKEEQKGKGIVKAPGGNRKAGEPSQQALGKRLRKEGDIVSYRRLYGVEQKGKRLSMVPGSYFRDSPRKSDLDIKDGIAPESSQRPNPFGRPSIVLDPMLQESSISNRRTTFLRDWSTKMPEVAYERKLKTLMEKGTESKMETMRMLKPEEVLSCRYLRLSKENIRTLLKLCKDAGMNVDIHPHMVEGEIDAKKVFTGIPSVAL
ncbi:uncharacterized protein C16orf78 homolog isoform X1 [Saimiri boliviensis]|uniref:Chromosome 16 open reading frame 78 n=1 Tax=Saimiri boliviensis boliviensis TaxID=39432 RepID=A0A2K6T5T8_SAIBB|nr:uncharacterized protein C16orf78 homolog isoform X2 [Saimiri boliviensis boliviensis]